MQLTSLSLALTRAGFLSAFSPASLFALGEQGAWFDPSDLTTLFTDAAGTTPVTAVEQPVGLMLDKSKGLVLGPELAVNGDFSSGTTGWSSTNSMDLSVVGGVLRATNVTPDAYGRVRGAAFSVVSGFTYRVSCICPTGSQNGFMPAVLKVSDNLSAGLVMSSLLPGATGVAYFVANTTGDIYFRAQNASLAAGSSFDIDNISVRELPGNHAFQTTATSRPVLSSRVNLLTKTEQFDDGYWFKSNSTVTANATAAPDGTLTADKLVEDTATSFHRVSPLSVTVVAGTTITTSVYAKAAERSGLGLFPYSSAAGVRFNLADGTIVSQESGVTASIVNIGNGWYRCSASVVAPASSAAPWILPLAPGNATNYTGDGTSGIYIWGASLVPANQADLPYQRVNTATDYDTVGFPRFLRADGVDDFMVTSTITPGTDKVQVFAGVRKLSDATGVFLELSQDALSPVINGAFFVFNSSTTTPNGYGFYNEGTLAGIATSGANYPPPITNVLTCLGDISGDRATLRVNSVQVAQSTADQGTGNYLAYPLYLFRRGGTSLPFNGHFYGGIIRFGPNLPIETIEQTEAYMAAKTGVTL